MPSKSAPTFRARRSGKVNTSLERRRLVSEPVDTDVDIEEDDIKSSPLKSLIWLIAIILLAFLAYWALKTYLAGDSNSSVTPTPVPTIEQSSSLVATNVLPDDPVAPFDDDSFWNTDSKQIQATSNTIDFTVESVIVQPHTSYVSVIYELSGGTLTDLPQVTAEMLSDISLAVESVANNNSLLTVNQRVDVNLAMVSSLSRISFEEGVDSYLVDLVEEQPFTLYSKVESGKKYVILDVLSPMAETTPTPVPSPDPSAGPSPTPLPAGSQNLNNEFGRNEQRITTSLTTDTARITKYNYFDAPDRFTYRLLLEDAIPMSSARLEGTTLTLEVSNLAFDGVVGNGGSGNTDLAATGVTHVLGVDITNTNNISRYVFTLDSARDFRLFADEDEKVITLEIKN